MDHVPETAGTGVSFGSFGTVLVIGTMMFAIAVVTVPTVVISSFPPPTRTMDPASEAVNDEVFVVN
jgi:hypothetical protein